MSDPKTLLIAAVLASAIGLALHGNKPPVDQVENAAATKAAATTAGARVAPTEPKLQVEPK